MIEIIRCRGYRLTCKAPRRLAFEHAMPETLAVAIDKQDMEEMLSNMLDGFGLAITRELVELYGSRFTLGRAAHLGGLQATMTLARP